MTRRHLVFLQFGARKLSACLCVPIAVLIAWLSVLSPQVAHAQISRDSSGKLPFNDILFIERGIIGGSEYNGSHFCDEFFGHNGKTGGGLFLLKNFQSASPQKVDIVAGLKVPAGRVNAGQTLSSGTFLSPDLSYDGKTVVFAWSSGGTEKWTAKNRFHLFRVDIDGKNLFQITDGNHDDMHPAWMPDGRIVFISTRRGGYGRCHPRAVPTYTLHSVKADGTDIIRLSDHETNEFHPSIANDGRIVYMRWDYIDRDALAAHHIWFCNPDGTNPRSWGGNYALPLDTFSGSRWSDGRKNGRRPQSEFYPRAIPGSKTKFVAVAGPHHGEAYGTLIIRDFAKIDDNELGQVTRLTPDVGFPETSENGGKVYGPAFPLSETLYLTSYNNTMVLVDTSVRPVRRTEIYRSSMRPIYGQPVMAREKPPIITPSTYQGARWCPNAPPATIQVNNVYVTDDYGKLPAGAKIKSMRIVQIVSKSTPLDNQPRLGYSSQNVAKMVLGTVPVEEDGSVFCEAPIGKLILFQLLDENGMAVQNMRSATYVHPGENMTCVGCHEDKMSAPPVGGTPSANKRAPSKIAPEVGRVEPINYYRLVKPVLDQKCYTCHKSKGAGPTDSSYSAQRGLAWWFAGDANGNLEPIHGGSRSKPGYTGALGSRMGKALLTATHKKALADGAYSADDMRAIVQWLDTGSDEFGAFEGTDRQRAGQLVWPALDVDKDDPQGLKYKPEGPHGDKCPSPGAVDPPVPVGPYATGGTTGSAGGAAGGAAGSAARPRAAGGTTGSAGGATGSATGPRAAGGTTASAGGAAGSVSDSGGASTGSGGAANSGAGGAGGVQEKSSSAANGGGGQQGSSARAGTSDQKEEASYCSVGARGGGSSVAWLLFAIVLALPLGRTALRWNRLRRLRRRS